MIGYDTKKMAVALALTLVSMMIAYVCWPNFFGVPHPHLTMVKRVKDNCGALLVAVREFAKTHNGAYPDHLEQVAVNRDGVRLTNPTDGSPQWAISCIVHGEREAIEFAGRAKAGLVSYCPVEERNKIVGFYILGTGEDGRLVPGHAGRPLVISSFPTVDH